MNKPSPVPPVDLDDAYSKFFFHRSEMNRWKAVIDEAKKLYSDAWQRQNNPLNKVSPPSDEATTTRAFAGSKYSHYMEWARELLQEWPSVDSRMLLDFFQKKASWDVTLGAVQAFIKDARDKKMIMSDPTRFGYVKLPTVPHD
jgi:hypothetical protein